MELSDLRPAKGSKRRKAYRRGRGESSGGGKTAGFGSKGQKARSGSPRPGFEGGQMPLYRRLPKRGFTNRNRVEYIGINLDRLSSFEDGMNIDLSILVEKGIIRDLKSKVKILGKGELNKKFFIKANAFSKNAKQKIQGYGGTCEVI